MLQFSFLIILLGFIAIGGGMYVYDQKNDLGIFGTKENIEPLVVVEENANTDVIQESVSVQKDIKPEPQVILQPTKKEDSPTVKILDKSKDLIVATTTTVIKTNVGTSNSLSDFVNNLKACKETKFNRSMTDDFLGNNTMTDVDYEINNNNGTCLLNVKVNKIELSLGEELSKSVGQPNTQFINPDGSPLDIKEFYKDLNKTYSSLIEKSGYCDIATNKDELIEFFTKEKGDFISYSDIAFLVFGPDLNCKGPVFDESQKLSPL